ncbi:MAG: hypothetical protein V1769_00640 [Thermoplasmatota archaeon]
MSIYAFMDRLGREIRIIRNDIQIADTKAIFFSENILDLFAEESIEEGDIVRTLDTNHLYRVIYVSEIRDEHGNIDHKRAEVQLI